MKEKPLLKKELVYPELSYQIVGVLFEVYNKIDLLSCGPYCYGAFFSRHDQYAQAEDYRSVQSLKCITATV